MVPHFSGKIQLGITQIDPSEIGSDLPAFPFERMALDTPFADKETGSLGRVLRENLGEGMGANEEKGDRYCQIQDFLLTHHGSPQ
jgi:hypothetical protein